MVRVGIVALPEDFSAPRTKWELLGFYILLVLATLCVTALLWRLPENFIFGDTEAIAPVRNRIAGWLTAVPAAIALFITLASRGPRAMLALLRRVLLLPPLWLPLVLLLPLAAQILALTLWRALFHGEVTDAGFATMSLQWLLMTPVAALVLLGSEIGWRGFVLPRILAYLSWRKAALLCGLLWAGWHMPLWLPVHIAATGSPPAAFLLVAANTLEAIAISAILTWMALRTNFSIALPALFLGAANAGLNLAGDLLDYRAADPSWAVTYATVLCLSAALFLMPARQ
jgi:membrane protease YdiL (CAAX protease family)